MAIRIHKFAYHVAWDSAGIARTQSGGRSGAGVDCDLSNYYTKSNLLTPGEALINSKNIFWAIQAGTAASAGVAIVSGRLIRDGLIKGVSNGEATIHGPLMAIYVSGGGDLYTNATPVPETIGGIAAGDTFAGRSMSEMWDALLYPYQYPAFSSFSISGQATTLECGLYVTAGTKSFVWNATNDNNVELNSISIEDVTRAISLITGTANDNVENLIITAVTSLVTGGTNTWRITGRNSYSDPFTRNWSVTWYSPYYYGVGAPGLSIAQIQQLTKSVASFGNKNYTFNPASQVYYFAYPAVYGELTSILDTNGFETIGDWTLRVENFTTNSPHYEGGTVSYNIYEFNNLTTQTNFINHFIY